MTRAWAGLCISDSNCCSSHYESWQPLAHSGQTEPQPTSSQGAGCLSPLARSTTGTEGESPGVSRCQQEIKLSLESFSLTRLIPLTQSGLLLTTG